MKTIHLLLTVVVVLCGSNSAFAQTWTPTSAPTNSWNAIASSADGTKLVAAIYGGGIYVSTNSGATWNLTPAPSDPASFDSAWESVASSADGGKLVAVAFYDTPIYLSTNGGASWSPNGPGENWQSVACSSDGNKIVAAAYLNGPIFISTNSGANWTQATNAPNNDWQSVASSADGVKLVAVSQTGYTDPRGSIFTSTNSGMTWISNNIPSEPWFSVASSADGVKLVAVSQVLYPAAGGSIFTSTNSGMTWTSNNIPSEPWFSVASSADGTKLVAVGYNNSSSSGSGDRRSGGIFTSTNSGATWTQTIGPSNYWFTVATSADGSKSVVAVRNDCIYSSRTIQSPRLNFAASTNGLCLSWVVPSTNFVMQLSPDLQNWVDLTNQPVLNLVNLQNEVILSPPDSNVFYRLKTQ